MYAAIGVIVYLDSYVVYWILLLSVRFDNFDLVVYLIFW